MLFSLVSEELKLCWYLEWIPEIWVAVSLLKVDRRVILDPYINKKTFCLVCILWKIFFSSKIVNKNKHFIVKCWWGYQLKGPPAFTWNWSWKKRKPISQAKWKGKKLNKTVSSIGPSKGIKHCMCTLVVSVSQTTSSGNWNKSNAEVWVSCCLCLAALFNIGAIQRPNILLSNIFVQ